MPRPQRFHRNCTLFLHEPMDFSAWSPSRTILVLFGIAVFIGQVAVYFYRTKQNDKKLEDLRLALREQGETFFHAIERLEERMDKGFVEVNQQIVGVRDELRDEIQGVRTEMNQQIGSVREELSKMNQNHIEHLSHHKS